VRFEVEANGHRHQVDARRAGGGWEVSFDGRPLAASLARVGERWSLLIGPPEDGHDVPEVVSAFRRTLQSYDIAIESSGRRERIVHIDGQTVRVSLAGSRAFTGDRGRDVVTGSAGPLPIESPMAGRVVTTLVQTGDAVIAGQGLVILEAMKMENELRAPRAGIVTDVRTAAGASIDAGTVLVIIE
jgi:acetyl/propionyl-CoA carboxylase alpha subunit